MDTNQPPKRRSLWPFSTVRAVQQRDLRPAGESESDPVAVQAGPSPFDIIFSDTERRQTKKPPPPLTIHQPEDNGTASGPPARMQEIASPVQTPDDSFADRHPDPELREFSRRHKDVGFLHPRDLTVSDASPRRVALIGSCFLIAWELQKQAQSCIFDAYTVNHGAELPDTPTSIGSVTDYDLQIIQIPLRSVYWDYMLTDLKYDDVAAHEKAFQKSTDLLRFQLERRMRWNASDKLLSFVANFPLPQSNIYGSLFPRFDIRNPDYYILKLNEALEQLVRSYTNAYILDTDRISSSFGRRYVQDDIWDNTTHNSVLGLADVNRDRLDPLAAMTQHYDVTWPGFLSRSIWAECLSMFRITRQVDAVKIIIVDLDDTLWRGVVADMEQVDSSILSGWQLGLIEALLYLKKRGILLAIASKNDEQRIRDVWKSIFGKKLKFSDFAITRINWQPKPDNVAHILRATNVLARNAVFIDDNPAERASVQHAFPDIRVLGRHPYYLRRVLLWSSETQCVSISEVSAARTEMIQAQIKRDDLGAQMSKQDFLEFASISAHVFEVGLADNLFSRAFELINKTNQFNTTGLKVPAGSSSSRFRTPLLPTDSSASSSCATVRSSSLSCHAG